MTKFKVKPEPLAAPSEIVRRFTEYRKLSAAAQGFGERADLIKQWLKGQAQEAGVEDEKGSRFLALAEPVDGMRTLKAEKRTSHVLDANMAEFILKKKKLLKACQRTITILDEDAVLALIFEGKISKAEENEMYTERVTWAFIPMAKATFSGD